ncbi:hypothetical protein UPYG_G00160090 [Umbra pygmaea]|uniref:Uncharacterized protein n=1 Tax=Umbra pygmaea TaxID=75934 RepID=A0ABD0XLP0_UMBPY
MDVPRFSVVALLCTTICCHGLQITQPETQCMIRSKDLFTASIPCQYSDLNQREVRDRRLNRVVNSKTIKVCQVNEKLENCTWEEKDDQYIFTLYNLHAEDAESQFQCEFITTPVGVKDDYKPERSRSYTKLIRDCEPANPSVLPVGCTPPATADKEGDLPAHVKWIVIVLAVFICCYSFLITFFYIRLRVRQSEELYDSLTYVRMQPNQAQSTVRRMARVDPVINNSTYMDMRKVQFKHRA